MQIAKETIQLIESNVRIDELARGEIVSISSAVPNWAVALHCEQIPAGYARIAVRIEIIGLTCDLLRKLPA